ncbi:MAG: helix-turn-helix domain-containing protein [Acidimicrobiia bacterium]
MSDSKQPVAEGLSGHVGEFIRSQRERADISLRRLAERAGISNPYLSQVERGLRKPSAEILKRISRALSISAESLYSKAGLIEEGPETPTVVEAIAEDPVLTPRQKQVLLDLYRTLVSAESELDAAKTVRSNQ